MKDRTEGIGVDPAKLRKVDPKALALRFAFGAVISAIAAVVSIRWGHKVGGLFLAFPAILPASLTLIEEKEGNGGAAINAIGAAVGGFALAVFGFVAAVTLGRLPLGVALLLAAATWIAVAVGLYFLARRALNGAAAAVVRERRKPAT